MAEHSFIRTSPFILRGELRDLMQVAEELFLDMQSTVDSQLLSATCYEHAVLDCIPMGDSCFLIKIRPDMRGLFLSQLNRDCRVFRVCRFGSKPETRLLLTDEISLKFRPTSTAEERRSCIGRYCVATREGEEPKDGTYRLRLNAWDDAITLSKSLRLEKAVEEAWPMAYTLPDRALMAN